jgi:hypothetical protein
VDGGGVGYVYAFGKQHTWGKPKLVGRLGSVIGIFPFISLYVSRGF